jgi:hypothetical protein
MKSLLGFDFKQQFICSCGTSNESAISVNYLKDASSSTASVFMAEPNITVDFEWILAFKTFFENPDSTPQIPVSPQPNQEFYLSSSTNEIYFSLICTNFS